MFIRQGFRRVEVLHEANLSLALQLLQQSPDASEESAPARDLPAKVAHRSIACARIA
jgi:hypothetical protein